MNFSPFFVFLSVSLLASSSLQASQTIIAENIASGSESHGLNHGLVDPFDESGEHEKAEDVAPSVGISFEINEELCDFSKVCLLIESTHGLIELPGLVNFLNSHREHFKGLLLYAAQHESFFSFSRLYQVPGAEELVAELIDENPGLGELFDRCRKNMLQACWGMSLEAGSGVARVIVVRSELFRRNLPEASSAGEPDVVMNDVSDDDSQFETLGSHGSEHETNEGSDTESSNSDESNSESSNGNESGSASSDSEDSDGESVNSIQEAYESSRSNRLEEEESSDVTYSSSESDYDESYTASELSESSTSDSSSDSDYEALGEDYDGFNFEDSEQRNVLICYYLNTREPEDIEGLVPFLRSSIVLFMDLLVYAARHEDKAVLRKLFYLEGVEFAIVLLFASALKDPARRLASEIRYISECYYEMVAYYDDPRPEPFYSLRAENV